MSENLILDQIQDLLTKKYNEQDTLRDLTKSIELFNKLIIDLNLFYLSRVDSLICKRSFVRSLLGIRDAENTVCEDFSWGNLIINSKKYLLSQKLDIELKSPSTLDYLVLIDNIEVIVKNYCYYWYSLDSNLTVNLEKLELDLYVIDSQVSLLISALTDPHYNYIIDRSKILPLRYLLDKLEFEEFGKLSIYYNNYDISKINYLISKIKLLR